MQALAAPPHPAAENAGLHDLIGKMRAYVDDFSNSVYNVTQYRQSDYTIAVVN